MKFGILIFLVAATMRYDLDLLARVPLGELLAFASVPVLLSGLPLRQFSKRLVPLFWIFGFWVLGVLISDFYNGMVVTNFLRGLAKPIWCIGWFLFFLAVICKSPKSLIWYPVGGVFAALQNYYFPQAWTEARLAGGVYDATAYGLFPILSSVAVVIGLFVYKTSKVLSGVVFLFYVFALILVGAPRSGIAIALSVSILLFYQSWLAAQLRSQRSKLPDLRLRNYAIYGIIGFLLVLAIFELYVFAASNRWLGEMQYQRYVSQSDTIFGNSILGLLMDGRTQVFGAILAIWDRPLLGFGSWTGIGLSYYFYDAIVYVGTDATELASLANAGVMPSPGHSIFFGGWMENGILTAVALLGLVVIMLKQFLLLLQSRHPLSPWLIAALLGFFWSFFFSPFGVGHRMVIGLICALFVTRLLELSPRAPRNTHI